MAQQLNNNNIHCIKNVQSHTMNRLLVPTRLCTENLKLEQISLTFHLFIYLFFGLKSKQNVHILTFMFPQRILTFPDLTLWSQSGSRGHPYGLESLYLFVMYPQRQQNFKLDLFSVQEACLGSFSFKISARHLIQFLKNSSGLENADLFQSIFIISSAWPV